MQQPAGHHGSQPGGHHYNHSAGSLASGGGSGYAAPTSLLRLLEAPTTAGEPPIRPGALAHRSARLSLAERALGSERGGVGEAATEAARPLRPRSATMPALPAHRVHELISPLARSADSESRRGLASPLNLSHSRSADSEPRREAERDGPPTP